jgi:hypothetical protein
MMDGSQLMIGPEEPKTDLPQPYWKTAVMTPKAAEIVAVYAFEVTGHQIVRIWSMLNPENLQLWRMT